MRPLPNELQRLAAKQTGALSHQQLIEHDFRPRDVERRIIAGLWQRITTRVIATHATPLERRTRLWAASLHHERLGLTGAAALECHGLAQIDTAMIDLLGPRGARRLPFDGCRISVVPLPAFSQSLSPLQTPVPVSVARAAGRAVSTRQAVFFITWAVQRRLTTLEELRSSISEGPQSPVLVAARRTLDLVDPGVHSMHEYDFARECRRRGLPVPARQTVRRDSEGRNRYTDVEFRVGSRALVVEIDGLQHLDMSVAIDDDWRENELRLQGLSLLRFSAIALQLEPDRCFDQITRALHELRRDAGAKAVP